MRKTKHILAVFILCICGLSVMSQEATMLVQMELYRLKLIKQHTARTETQKDFLDKVDEKAETLSNMANVMNKIYDGYCCIVETFETATGVLNTYREMEQLIQYLDDVKDMYEYGVKFDFQNMYGFEKYLNTDLQLMYLHQLESSMNRAEGLMQDLLTYVPRNTGSVSARMKYEEGLRHIRQMCMDMREIDYEIYSTIGLFKYLCKARQRGEGLVQISNTFFDFEQYHYTVVWKN